MTVPERDEGGIFKSYDEMTPDQRVAYELGYSRARKEYVAVVIALILSSGGSIRVKKNLLMQIGKHSIVQSSPDIRTEEIVWSACL